MASPLPLGVQTKTGYMSRILLLPLYVNVPPWLLQRFENFRQRFAGFLGHLKEQFPLTFPASADNALKRLLVIVHCYPDAIQTFPITNELIRDVLDDPEQCKSLLRCRDREAQCLLDLFQSCLDTGSTIIHQPRLRNMTIKLAVASGMYPRSYYLGDIVVSNWAECFGGCADIHKAERNGQYICAKVVRRNQTSKPEIYFEAVITEAILWRQCHHRNILPFLGIHPISNRIYLISRWMKNGNITEYLKRNQTSSRSQLVIDIARGVEYLHEHGIVHRDLKGNNILVDEERHAVLADFGSSFAIDDPPFLTSPLCGGTVRWQAPELFECESSEMLPGSEDQLLIHASKSKASDVYAFGMVCLEIYTGQVPFARFQNDLAIKARIIAGKRPERPVQPSDSWSTWGLTEDMWSLMEACWQREPEKRPTILEVVDNL